MRLRSRLLLLFYIRGTSRRVCTRGYMVGSGGNVLLWWPGADQPRQAATWHDGGGRALRPRVTLIPGLKSLKAP